MLSKKEIEQLKAGALGVTRSGLRVRFICEGDENRCAVCAVFWGDGIKLEYYSALPYYQLNGNNILDIVGLWEDKPDPFDLERALAGEPVLELETNKKCYLVRSINNEKAYILERDDGLLGYVYDEPNYFADNFIMWKDPEPVKQSTDDLPQPIKDFGDLEKVWHIHYHKSLNSYIPYARIKGNGWTSDDNDSLRNGCYYATEEDCQKVCKWLMGR